MEFCLYCKKLLKLNKNLAICNCGFSKVVEAVLTNEKIQKPIKKGEGIANKEEINDRHGFPHKCKKCGYDFAEVNDLGAFYGDESNVYLFKCNKCNYVEREACGSGNS